MKNVIFLISISLFSVSVYAQGTRFLSHIDSTYVPDNKYIEDYTIESFYDSEVGDIPIRYDELESDLLNAAVFFALNKYREDRRKTVLEYETHLDFLSYNCAHYYSKSKFKYSKRNDLLFEKNLYLASRHMPLKYHLFSANTCLQTIMKVDPKRKIHRNDEDGRSDFGLYYRGEPEDEDVPEEVVEVYTYNEFAEQVVAKMEKRNTRRRLVSKSYITTACYVYIEPKSMKSNKPPYAKVIQIIGARRLVVE